MRYIIGILLLMNICIKTSAQVSFQFNPETNGRTVDAVLNTRIINTSGSTINGTLNLIVTETKTGVVFQLNIQQLSLKSGMNLLPRNMASNYNLHFSPNSIGSLISQTGRFPEGDYQYCFTFNVNHAEFTQDCFQFTVEPSLPLMLMDPYHLSEICNLKPNFQWQPMVPAVSGLYYQFVLVELKEKQSPSEALVYNIPIVRQTGIKSPFLIYPPSMPDLVEGKSYVWQVSALVKQTVITRSEIWKFSIKCQNDVVAFNDDGFRNIDDLSKGNFYIAEPHLKFYFKYPFVPDNLNYTIEGITNVKQKINQLPKVKLKTGDNYLSIDLDDIGKLINDQFYILTIHLPDGDTKKLRFLYRSIYE